MKGNDWSKKKFTVPMSPGMVKLNLCHECLNNKYHGGSAGLCDACVNHSNLKKEIK